MAERLAPTVSVAPHSVSIHHVEHLLLGAAARGLDTSALMLRAGISPGLRDSPLSRVTQDQLARLIRQVRHRLRDELWGLCSHPVRIGSFAQAAQLAVHCATLGEALAAGLRHYRLLLSDFVPRLQRHAATVAVSVTLSRPEQPLTPSLAYAQRAFAFLAYRLACWVVARHLPLLAVDYPRHDSRTEEGVLLFQAPVHLGMGRVGWHLDARWLDLPVVQTEQSLRVFLRQAPASLIVKYRDQRRVSESIRSVLRQQFGEGGAVPSLEQVGRQLAIEPRTLRRRLHEEGARFRQLKDELRRDAAIEYLTRHELTLPQIAQCLGFSEASTFHRAFKHWTGMAPGEYRQMRLRNED